MKKLFLAFVLLLGFQSLSAQQFDNPAKVRVDYYGYGVIPNPNPGSIVISGSSNGSGSADLPPTPASTPSSGPTSVKTGVVTTYLVPGKEYEVFVTSVNLAVAIAIFPPLNGHELYIDGRKASAKIYETGNSGAFKLRVEKINDITQNLAGQRGGQASSFPEDKPIWYIGLGSLRNGRFAGAVGFRADTISSALWQPEALVYDSVDTSEVPEVERVGNRIKTIRARDVWVHVDPYDSATTSYQIRVCLAVTPTTPFITYTVRQYAGGNGVRIDKVEDGITWSTALSKSGATWTMLDWQKVASSSSALATGNAVTTTESGNTSTVNYGSGAGMVTKHKTFTTVNGQRELASVTWGPGTTSALTTSYEYYADSTGSGWKQAVKSIVEPSGNWVKYDYFNTTTANDYRAGHPQRIYRPWKDAPTSPAAATSTNCLVETYDYDVTGPVVSPSLREVRVNGTLMGKTTWSYNWAYATTPNGRALAQSVRSDFPSNSGTPLATTTLFFTPNSSNPIYYHNQPHAITRPDGTKDAYAYFNGTWNPTTRVFSASSDPNAGARQVLIFHGQATASGATTALSAWGSWALDTVHLVPHLSTVSQIITDAHGRVVHTGEFVYTSGGLGAVASQANSYNDNNLLSKQFDMIRSVGGGEVAVNYTYTAGLRTAKTDIDGTKTEWTYDSYLRNDTIKTAATSTNGSYPAKTQTFTYYSSNRKQTARECDCSPTVTTYNYEATGRVSSISEPKPDGGSLVTSYSYPTLRQTTVTLPTGATRTTTLFYDGRVKSETGTGVVDTQTDYSVDGTHFIRKTRNGSTDANGWLEEKTDWLGRIAYQRTPQVTWTSGSNKIVRKAYAYDTTKGQLVKLSTRDEGNADARMVPDHLYVYGDLGLLVREGDDVNGNNTLGEATTDRITDYARSYYQDGSGGWLFQETTRLFRTLNNSADKATISDRHTRLSRFNNGTLHSANTPVLAEMSEFDSAGRETRVQERANYSTRTRTRSTLQPGATQSAVTIWQDGYLKSEQSVSGVTKTYAYASTGLLTSVTEGTTNVATTYTYHTGTQYIASVVQTTGASATATTTYAYTWNTGNQSHTVSSTLAGNTAYTEYNALGLPWRTWGTAALPTLTTYDAYGRRTGLRTWQTGTFTGATWPSPAGGELVTWNLDPATGAVMSKVYANGSDVAYTYNARGQVKTRRWARGVTTTYNYFDTLTALTGELSLIDYSDATPDVSFTYTRTGALATVNDAAGARTFNYRGDLMPETEVFGAYYGSNTLTTTYDSLPRIKGYSFNGNVTASISIGVDAATGRPKTIAGTRGSTSQTFTLTYASGTDWVSSVTNGGSFTRATPLLSASGGKFNALASVTTTWASKTLGQFTAQYDTTRGWRNGQDSGSSAGTHADSWTKVLNLGDGINAAAASYDGLGQLLGTGAPAWQNVAGSVSLPTRNLSWTYDLAGNRKTESEAGGASTIYSTADTNPNADGRLNQYESITGTRAEPGIAYDADGNLTQDSVWTYSYDAENRLKTLTKAGQTITMDYDYLGRRIRKTVTGTGAYDIKFLWTGWQLAAELGADGDTVNKVFIWGRDFSDAQGNAGGAGALLAQIAGTTISYAVPDAYGSIVGYITSANGGKLVAAVEFSPYGKGVNGHGAVTDYPIGFSGQYMDWEPGLVYYGMRHYAPKHGRFINRDPIEEQGGNNLYGFVGNSPYRGWDVLGLRINRRAPPQRWKGNGPLGFGDDPFAGEIEPNSAPPSLSINYHDGPPVVGVGGRIDSEALRRAAKWNGAKLEGIYLNGGGEVDGVRIKKADGSSQDLPVAPNNATTTNPTANPNGFRDLSAGQTPVLIEPNTRNAGMVSTTAGGPPLQLASFGTSMDGLREDHPAAFYGGVAMAGTVGGVVVYGTGAAAAPAVVAAARPAWVAVQVAVIAHGPGVGNTATSALRFVQYQWYRAQAAITQIINAPKPPPPPGAPPVP